MNKTPTAAALAQLETFLHGLKSPTIVVSAEGATPFRSLILPREVFVELVRQIAASADIKAAA
jgi:hypothetical protein